MITIERKVHFGRGSHGRRRLKGGKATAVPVGRIPHISKLMALAIRLEQLIRDGYVADYAELARLGHVTRARLTQIMNLTLLAPDIQEELLTLPRIERGRGNLQMRQLQPVTQMHDWRGQRRSWAKLKHSP